MTEEKEIILSDEMIRQKIRRIAYQIIENNLDESKIIIAGIFDRGYTLAQLIISELLLIDEHKNLQLVRIELNKVTPLDSEVIVDCSTKELDHAVVILVDDVLNSGKTLAYAMRELLKADIRKIETAVLVNRSYKKFPVSAKYMGYELSTTINEHVEVNLTDEFAVYLK